MTQENKFEAQASKDPRQIEAAIGDTRNALTDDIKALSDKASPAHIKQEAKQALKNAKDNVIDKGVQAADVAVDRALEIKDVAVERALEIKDAAVEKASEVKELALTKAHEAADVIAEKADEVAAQTRDVSRVAWQFTVNNAVPLSLIGLGAGLLITNQRKSQSARLPEYDASWDVDDEPVFPEDYPADNLAFVTDIETPVGTRTSGAIRPRRKAAAPALNKAGARLRQSSKSAYDKAGQSLEQAEHKLADTAARSRDAVQERLRNVQRASRDFAQANPLALAFGTLLAGVGVGLLLPSTSREDTLLRPARNRIRGALGEARRTAQDVTDLTRQTIRDGVSDVAADLHSR